MCAEEIKRAKDEVERKKVKEERRKEKALQAAGDAAKPAAQSAPEAAAVAAPAKAQMTDTPVAFLFPGQGSQAVGMLKVGCSLVLLNINSQGHI